MKTIIQSNLSFSIQASSNGVGLPLLLTLLFCFFWSNLAYSEQKITKENWDIHYIAFNSTFLQPEIAENYQIIRSKYNAVINISVLDTQQNQQAQRVYLKGKATNLIGQDKPLIFKQIISGQSIYYLAQLYFNNEETFKFAIELTQGERQETLIFQQTFYAQ